MKLTHLALVLAFGLCGVTAWMALDARNDAKGIANQFDLYKKRNPESGGVSDREAQEREHQLLMQQLTAAKEASSPPAFATTQAQPAAAPQVPAPAVNPAPVAPDPTKVRLEKLEQSGHVGPAALASQAPALTSWQRKVLAAPAIGKVKGYNKDWGIVDIEAGANRKVEKGMIFAIRRGNSVIGKVKISQVEDRSALGEVDIRSLMPGVTVEAGDEAIQDIPPEA